MHLRIALLFLAGLAVAAVPAARGDDPSPADQPTTPALPAPSEDPAFDRFVDFKLLQQAVADLDPAALADCGLQLAEGERVLFRPHKGVTADAVLGLAVRAAAEQRDKDTLARLAAAAKALGKAPLAAQADAAQKLALTPSRAADPLGVDASAVSGDVLHLFEGLREEARAAKLLADAEAVERLGKELDTIETLPEKMKEALRAEFKAAAEGMRADDPKAAMLRRLAAPSRSLWDGTPARPVVVAVRANQTYPPGTIALDLDPSVTPLTTTGGTANVVMTNQTGAPTIVQAGSVALSVPSGAEFGLRSSTGQARTATKYRWIEVKIGGTKVRTKSRVGTVTVPGVGFGLTGAKPRVVLR